MPTSCKRFCSLGIMKKSTLCKLLNAICGLENYKIQQTLYFVDLCHEIHCISKKSNKKRMHWSCKPHFCLRFMKKSALWKLWNAICGLKNYKIQQTLYFVDLCHEFHCISKKLNKNRMHSSCKCFCSLGIIKKSTSCTLLNKVRGFEIIKYSKHGNVGILYTIP